MNTRTDYFRGVIAMIASNLFFSTMALLVRYASGIDPYKAAFFRFAVGMALLVTLALWRKIRLTFNASRVLFFRGFAGGIAVFLFYLSIRTLGVAKGTVISNTYPVFAALGGMLFLKDRVKPAVWPLMAVSVLGIFLMSPSWKASAPEDLLWYFLALLGSVLAAAAVVSVKKLSETDSPYAIFMAQCVIGFWLLLIPSNLVPLKAGISGGVLLLAIGLAAAGGQLLMTYSYSKIDIPTGSLLGILQNVINVVVGIFLFGERLGLKELAGVTIILAACTAIVSVNSRPTAGAEVL